MLSDSLAEVVRRTRREKGVTREQLAQRCAALGWPDLTVGALGSIETGRPDSDRKRRRQVTVDEWLVLAQALNVPPLVLVCPPKQSDVELFPGTYANPPEMIRWITGDIADQSERPAWIEAHQLPSYRETSTPLVLLREHDWLAREWRRGNQELEHALEYKSAAADPKLATAAVEFAQREQLQLERQLKNVRRRLSKLLAVLPPAPAPHLDARDDSLE
jgi:transcriptional regulator with XRE-family HTH domain